MNRPIALLIILSSLALLLDLREAAAAVREDSAKPYVAVFSPENLTGRPAPLRALRESLVRGLLSLGISVLDDASLDRFMTRHRVRYAGGIDSLLAKALKDEEKIDAVLITSVELYDEDVPPKIVVLSRLVSTGERAEILWMESSAMAGDDSPGILGLGLVLDSSDLREKVVQSIINSLERHLLGEKPEVSPLKEKYYPKFFYRAADFPREDKRYTVAVVPFFNVSDRKYGGEIMVRHFVAELVKRGGFAVVEPGLVRQKLLNTRTIMYEGISLTDADIVAISLQADVVLAGKVSDYQDFSGPIGDPRTDFLTVMIEGMTKKMVWASVSYNTGNEGVFFFDFGKVNTAGKLASYMTGAVAEGLSLSGQEIVPGREELPYSPQHPE